MKRILVTGAKGFIGKNLIVTLKRRGNVDVIEYDLDSPAGTLEEGLAKAEVIYHLAGVNRPERVEEFTEGNLDLTRHICDALRKLGRAPLCVLSSSCQASLDNPYGLSERRAEEAVFDFGKETRASALFNQDDLIALRTEKGVHRLIPGITGWAQINGRDDIPIPRKVEYDEYYLKNRSFLFDLKILFLTVFKVTRAENVSH